MASLNPDGLNPASLNSDAVNPAGLNSDAVNPAGLNPADLAPFLARLTRLDRDAVVRLRPAGGGAGADRGPGAVVRPDARAQRPPPVRTVRPDARAQRPPPVRTAVWGRVPWGALVTRTIPGAAGPDTTVGALALLRSLTEGDGSLPAPRDRDWRWALPPAASRAVEELPAAEIRRVGTAAADTLRAARGRIGERVLRDALLDHVPIVVTAEGEQIEIRQGLVQAVLRMAFMAAGEGSGVTVRIAGTWVGLVAEYGSTWAQKSPTLAFQVTR